MVGRSNIPPVDLLITCRECIISFVAKCCDIFKFSSDSGEGVKHNSAKPEDVKNMKFH